MMTSSTIAGDARVSLTGSEGPWPAVSFGAKVVAMGLLAWTGALKLAVPAPMHLFGVELGTEFARAIGILELVFVAAIAVASGLRLRVAWFALALLASAGVLSHILFPSSACGCAGGSAGNEVVVVLRGAVLVACGLGLFASGRKS